MHLLYVILTQDLTKGSVDIPSGELYEELNTPVGKNNSSDSRWAL